MVIIFKLFNVNINNNITDTCIVKYVNIKHKRNKITVICIKIKTASKTPFSSV